MRVIRECPMCREIVYMDNVDEHAYNAWKNEGKLIQDAFPNMNAEEREFIMTGYCFECQEMLFANPFEDEEETETDKDCPCDIPDNNGEYHCPYNAYGSDDCRNYCGLGVDE